MSQLDQSALLAQLVPFLTRRGYEPGERIPSERELSVRFGVGRGQMRDALALLEALRVVQRRSKSGLFMGDEVPSVEAMALFARIGIPLDQRDVEQTVEMRRIHEVEAVRLACARRKPTNIDRMREVLESADLTEDDAELAEHDRMFHTEIVRATQNDVFLRVVNIFYLMTEGRRVAYFRQPGRRERSRREHRQIFEAIVAGDGVKAAGLVEDHLQGVDSYWRHFVEQSPQDADDLDGRDVR